MQIVQNIMMHLALNTVKLTVNRYCKSGMRSLNPHLSDLEKILDLFF